MTAATLVAILTTHRIDAEPGVEDLYEGDEYVIANRCDVQIAGNMLYVYSPDGEVEEVSADDISQLVRLLHDWD